MRQGGLIWVWSGEAVRELVCACVCVRVRAHGCVCQCGVVWCAAHLSRMSHAAAAVCCVQLSP